MAAVLSSGEFPKLRVKAFAPVQERETPESKYWRTFSEYHEINLQGTPLSINFHPSQRGLYLVTHSTKVSLYHSNGDKLQRSYTRFNEDAYSGKFRPDGKLIIAGDREGYVKVFDMKTKSMLRQIKGHKAAARAVSWISDGLGFVSASDDNSVKRWDLATEELVWQSKSSSQHGDYVRALDVSPIHTSSFVTGSYDHTIKIWDSRQNDCTNSMDHGHPIEYCLLSPSGALAFSAGGNEVKVWDILSGGKLLHTFNNHQKNITGLCMNDSGSRLLSCGLDGFVKIYNMEMLQVVHGIKYNSPCISIGSAADDSKLIVGSADGTLAIRDKAGEVDDEDKPRQSDGNLAKRQKRFYKGAGSAVSKAEDGFVESERSERLAPYEVHLQKFNYQMALDSALSSRNPVVVITVLEELFRRDGLVIALSGRDESSLEPLLSFAAKYVASPRYTRTITQVAHVILDLYAPIIGQSDAIDELFLKLRKQIKLEVTFQRQVSKVVNALDGLINISSSRTIKRSLNEIESNEVHEDTDL